MNVEIQHAARGIQQTEAPQAACYAVSGVFSRHYRKVKAIFGLTDVFFLTLAFFAAYQTRLRMHFESFHEIFFINLPIAAVLLLVSVLSWVAIGYWFNIYEKLDSAHPSVVLRDTFRQCVLGSICVVVAEYGLRLDLSRPLSSYSHFTPGYCSACSG